MLSKDIILILHEESIKKYGGAFGIRDEGLMESAIARPLQSFDGNDLYPSIIEKASAIIESIIINHPFVDGNKRTGYLAMLAYLKIGNIEIMASNDELYNFTISISTSEIHFDEIVHWLKQNTKTL
jgi:death on curing protein